MNKTVKIATAVLALSTGAGAAYAASSHEAVGKIERINPKSQHLTLNHRVYRYNSASAVQDLKTGEKVRVQYRWERGHRVADSIQQIKS